MPAVQSVLDKYSGVFDAAVDMLHVADKCHGCAVHACILYLGMSVGYLMYRDSGCVGPVNV